MDVLGHGRRETSKDGDGGNKRPMFRDLLGMDCVIREFCRATAPLHHLKLLRQLGVESIAPILLSGPPRCGKTTLARALANEAGLPLYEISAAELVSRVSGAPEENIRELFSKAYMRAPSIVFLDDIEELTSKKKSLHKDIVKQLMACMDEPYRHIRPVNHDAGSESSNSRPGYVLVIGATNRSDALDPVLRRRFDREIVLRAPNAYERREILTVLTRNLKVDIDFDLVKIARCTLGFVVEDLAELVKKAGICAANRIIEARVFELYAKWGNPEIEDWSRPISDEEMRNLSITFEDFVKAAKMVRPSYRLEGFSTTTNANWDDVGGLQSLKLEFERHIVMRLKSPKVYKDLGVDSNTTFFLYGPSGCGKRLIVEALANEAGANFLHIKGFQLLNYGDQSELVVHIMLNYARAHSPCILLFDELEAIIPGGGEGLDVEEFRKSHIANLLTELSDQKSSGVYVIVATNSTKVASHLLSTLGDFDMIQHVPLPSPVERGAILKALARNKPIDAHVDLMALGKDDACENFSGADLSELMRVAVKAAFDRQTLSGGGCRVPWTIKDADFNTAMAKVSPSISSKEVENWKLVTAQCKIALCQARLHWLWQRVKEYDW